MMRPAGVTIEELDEDALECARAGLAWLEQVCPDHIDRINLSVFDINDCNVCALGQIFGDYWRVEQVIRRGLAYTEIVAGWMSEHGFIVHEEAEDDEAALIELNEAWLYLLTERRRADR